MATDPKKRQKKLERRASKRKEKNHLLVKEKNIGMAQRLTIATKYPILNCWISDAIEDQGIGWVTLSRESPEMRVMVVAILIDRYCLGVKDIFMEILPRSQYETKYQIEMMRRVPSHSVPPAEARKFVEQAAEYARNLGFASHPDYRKAMTLFGSVNSAESDAVFEFGKDGKPFFVSGPRDTVARCRQIHSILTKSCGPGGFEYLIVGDEEQLFGPEGFEGLEGSTRRIELSDHAATYDIIENEDEDEDDELD